MTKEECLKLLKLLSALETQLFNGGSRVPDHLYDAIAEAIKILEREILK